MAIARKIEPTRTPKRMESGTKRIPKFVQQNGRVALKRKPVTEEVPGHYRDHSFSGTTTRGRVTPDNALTLGIPWLPEADVSEAPTIPVPTSEPEAPTPDATPSEAPLMMSNSAFEELLGAPTPEPVRVSPPLLLTLPKEALPCPLPRPEPELASVEIPMRSRWTTWLGMAGVMLVAGAALFGGAYWAKTTSSIPEAPAAAAPKTAPVGPSQARAALASGDLDRAGKLFEELAVNPSTRMDGLTGLAEVSRAHGDVAGARARYRDILTESPQYFPAKLGEADTTWDLGEKDSARDQYAALETKSSSQVLPPRVHERAKRR
jgi:hypothetical protein